VISFFATFVQNENIFHTMLATELTTVSTVKITGIASGRCRFWPVCFSHPV